MCVCHLSIVTLCEHCCQVSLCKTFAAFVSPLSPRSNTQFCHTVVFVAGTGLSLLLDTAHLKCLFTVATAPVYIY